MLLRGVENRRNIFFMYITRCVSFARIIPRRGIKLGKRDAKRTFSNHAWFARWLMRLKEKEKRKKTTTRNGIASRPLSTIYPSRLAFNSCSELWVTLSTTCSAQWVKEGPFWFLTCKVNIVVEFWLRGVHIHPTALFHNTRNMTKKKDSRKLTPCGKLLREKRKKKKENEREKEQKKRDY